MKCFISYAHKDIEIVRPLVETLETGGHSSWFDEALKAGIPWKDQLADAIKDNDALVIALTPNWLSSEWCQWEFVRAIEASKKIIPVLLADAQPPVAISEYQYADFRDGFDDDAKVSKFLADLDDLAVTVPKEQAPEAPDEPKGEPSRVQIEQHVTLGDVSGDEVNIVGQQQIERQTNVSGSATYIEKQEVEQARNKWVFIGIGLLIILGVIAVGVAFYSTLPDVEQQNLQYSIGLIPATITPTPRPLLRQYNVGVAVGYFSIPDDGSVDRDEADALAEQIAAQLDPELREFLRSLNPDFSVGFLGPDVIGQIRGENPAERLESAEEIADFYEADVVLYGSVEKNSRGLLEFSPEFYVSPEEFIEAREVIGAYRLGNEIEVAGPLDAIRNVMNLNEPLRSRTRATALIFMGLSYYAAGDYQQALDLFTQANEFPGADGESIWEDVAGREVLYVLLGNAQGKLASTALQNQDPESALELLPDAAKYFDLAIETAPDYSRGYTGMAASNYLGWAAKAQLGESDTELLLATLDFLNDAGEKDDYARQPSIKSRELFARLQADYALLRFYGEDDSLDLDMQDIRSDFEGTSEIILSNYNDGADQSMRSLAAETYGYLGLLACSVDRDLETGVENLTNAIELQRSAQRLMFFNSYLATCHEDLGETETAASYYQTALDLAESTPDTSEELIEYYQGKVEQYSGRG